MIRWILAVAGTLLLALAVFLAIGAQGGQDARRVAAWQALESVRRAAAEEVVRAVAEAGSAGAAWTPGAPLPAPLAGAWTDWGEDTVSDSMGGVPVSFTRAGDLDIYLTRADGSRRKARVAAAELRRRIEVRPEVGPRSADGTPGAWWRIVVADARGDALLALPAPAPPAPGKRADDAPARSPGLDLIATGKPFAPDANGRPPHYKGHDDAALIASAAPVAPDSAVHVLAELPDRVALGDTAGIPLGWGGRELTRLQTWHGALLAGLLCFVGVVFAWAARRDGRMAVVMRSFVFARPYALGIVVTVLAGTGFSVAQIVSKTFLVKKLSDDVFAQGGDAARESLVFLAWATVGIGLAMAVFGYLREYLQTYYATAMIADIRIAIGRKILGLPMSYLQRMRAGDLVARIERDTLQLRQVLSQVFEHGFLQPFVVVSSLVAAVMMNWRLAIVLLGMPLVVYPLFRIGRVIKKRARKRQELLADISHVLFQILTGLKVIKAFGGEKREAARLDDVNRRYIREARKIQRLHALSKALLDLLQMSGGAILVYAGGLGIIEGGVSLGDLIAFLAVVQQIYVASKEITSTLNKLIEATPGTERVWEILDAPDTLPEGTTERAPGPLRTGIELRGVRFRYLDNDILRGVDLTIPAGQVVALVGPTGAGKTTLCDLVARFYDPVEGQVLHDGTDVREFTRTSLARSIAIVTQDAFLFNAPIEENIAYGRPGATQEETHEAARAAFVHEDILAMDGGYAKVAGERGTSVSGGQRQRITIARAILKDAPVLILDEATSNLDSRSESMVQEAMKRLMQGRTVIVVAHRLSTIRNADKVVVLEGGVIVEQGAPKDLLADPAGRFRRMWDAQMGTEGATPGAED